MDRTRLLAKVSAQEIINKIQGEYYALRLFDLENDQFFPLTLSPKLEVILPDACSAISRDVEAHIQEAVAKPFQSTVLEAFSLAGLSSLTENDKREIIYLLNSGCWVKATFLPLQFKAGKAVIVLAALRDITDSKLQLEELAEEKRIETTRADNYFQLFVAAAEELYVGIVKIKLATGSAYKIILDNGSIVERPIPGGLKTLYRTVLEDIHPDDKNAVLQKTAYGHLEKLPMDHRIEYAYRKKDKKGQYRWYSTFLRLGYDYYGKLIATIFTSDINAEIMERARLKDLSEHDALSYLFNRTKLELMTATEYQTLSSCGVLFFDINNLKEINDTLGHEAGDELICQVADSIRSITNRKIHAYRLGGDEFIAVICDISQSAMDRLVHMWKARLNELTELSGRTCSVAVGTAWSQAPVIVEELIEEADQAMYANKKVMKAQLAAKAAGCRC